MDLYVILFRVRPTEDSAQKVSNGAYNTHVMNERKFKANPSINDRNILVENRRQG